MLRLDWLSDSDLAEWDEFQMESPRGHYCQLSSWLKSFRAFGGKERVVVARGSDGDDSGWLRVHLLAQVVVSSGRLLLARSSARAVKSAQLQSLRVRQAGRSRPGLSSLILQPTVPRSAAPAPRSVAFPGVPSIEP